VESVLHSVHILCKYLSFLFCARLGLMCICHRYRYIIGSVQVGFEACSTSDQMDTKTVCLEVKRPGREINHSYLMLCCRMHGIIRTSTPYVAFMEWQGLRNCLNNFRDLSGINKFIRCKLLYKPSGGFHLTINPLALNAVVFGTFVISTYEREIER
jgi:hypothetical protein